MAAETPTTGGTVTYPKSLRRFGCVLGLTATQVLVWINGVTVAEGEWVERDRLPAVLHQMEATFDVWLRDGQPVRQGAYAEQIDPHTHEPYSQSGRTVQR